MVFHDRDRIARDLHDQVIQRLYAAGMSLQGITPFVTSPQVGQRIQQAIDAMDEAISDIRSAIFSLHSRHGDQRPGLGARIVAIADEMTQMLGFVPSVRLGSDLDAQVSDELAEQLLTVLREALSNAARHSRASQVEISVEAGSELALRVTDDGIGIGPHTRRSGLANLARRAAELGGTLRTGPADQTAVTGTSLDWQIPIHDLRPGLLRTADGG